MIFCLSRLRNPWRRDDREECFDAEDPEEYAKVLFWNRIAENVDSYIEDFREKRDRIFALIDREDIDAEKKAVLMEIADKIR